MKRFILLILLVLSALPAHAGNAPQPPDGILAEAKYEAFRYGKIKMHTGPGKQYPVEWVYLRKSLPVKVVATYDVWRKVVDPDNTTGWVQETMLSEKRTVMVTGRQRTPISQPTIDYSMGGKISITTQAQFLAAARQFTAVGNSAYAGAAQFLVSSVPTLQTAAQILGAEGQHLGAVNYLCCLQGVMSPAVDALDFPPIPTNQSYFTISSPTTSTGPALGPSRTTSQVLGIVYGVATASTTTPQTGVASGGFFPSGVNGNIKST